MRRVIFRPFFNLHQPFLPFCSHTVPQWQFRVKNNQPQYETQKAQKSINAHDVFQQFFKEHEPKTREQKEFFKKHHPQKVQEVYDPFKILQINKNSSLEEIKQAYRKLALKYHPKINTTPQASNKFSEIAKAYQNIMQSKRSRDFGELGINGLQDVTKLSEELARINNNTESKEPVTNKQGTKSKEPYYGQFFSESSQSETVNGRQVKYVSEKIYKKDGQLLNVKREQKLKEDGKVQITQTIDNGKEVKKKTFVHEIGAKQIN